jgi:hypothetical protein
MKSIIIHIRKGFKQNRVCLGFGNIKPFYDFVIILNFTATVKATVWVCKKDYFLTPFLNSLGDTEQFFVKIRLK